MPSKFSHTSQYEFKFLHFRMKNPFKIIISILIIITNVFQSIMEAVDDITNKNGNERLFQESNGNASPKKLKTMDYNYLLTNYIGEGGRYQMAIAFILMLTSVPGSFSAMEMVFFNLVPSHWCDIGTLSPALSALNQSQVMYLSIPNAHETVNEYEPKPCVQYDRNYADATADDIEGWIVNGNSTKTTSCNKWTYEESRLDDTITTKVYFV